MSLNKKIVLPVLGLSLAGATFLGATQVSAASDSTDGGHMSSLIQKIATKFNLNQDEVKAVFEEDRTAHRAEMETKYEAQLTQLVTDGKITQAQKDLIRAKHKELEANRESKMESMKGKTDAERKTAMEAERTALQTWATQNGIDMKYLMGVRGRGHQGGGFGKHGGRGEMGHPQSSSTPAPTVAQ